MIENENYFNMAPASVIPVRGVTQLEFDGSKLAIEGFAFFEELEELDPNKIELELLIKNNYSINDEQINDEQIKVSEFVFPTTKNYPKGTIKAFDGNENKIILTQNYSYQASIDFRDIDNGAPLKTGEYQIYIRLKQYIDDSWKASEFTVGALLNSSKDYVYTTKIKEYAAKKVTTYSFGVQNDRNSNNIYIHSKKLSSVNPNDLIVDDDVIEDESKIIRRIKKAIFYTAYEIFKFLPVKKNSVAFLSDSRNDLTGNFEYIYRELKRRNSKLKTSFYFKRTNNEPKTLKEYLSLAKVLATSKYILLDDFYPLVYPLKIRNKIELIQVWHAVGAFKTFGFSRVGMSGGPSIKSKNHRNYSRAIVSSKNVVSNYAEGFGIDKNKIKSIGAPRTDMFFDQEETNDILTNVYEEIPFVKGKKVILFAPTFRGNGQQSAYYPFDWLDYQKMYDTLKPQGYVFLFKIHPFVKNSPAIPYEFSDFFYDVSEYREINNLLLVANVLITDYSSVVFEYSLLKRKTIFFAPDLSEYMNSRNFYVDFLNFIPGPFVDNVEDLVDEIQNESINLKRINSFLDYYFDDLDGKSSERFVDLLENGFEEEINIESTDKEFTESGKWIPKWGNKD